MELDVPVGDSQLGPASATERAAEVEKKKQVTPVTHASGHHKLSVTKRKDNRSLRKWERTTEAEHTLTTIRLVGNKMVQIVGMVITKPQGS